MSNQINGYVNAALLSFLAQASPSADAPHFAFPHASEWMSPVVSETIEEPLFNVQGQIASVVAESTSSGWDGYDAKPISKSAEFHAFCLTSHLVPFCRVVPDVASEPDGSIELEWFRNKNWRLVVSIDGNGIVSYAAKCGADSQTGRIVRIDDLSVEGLRRILSSIYA